MIVSESFGPAGAGGYVATGAGGSVATEAGGWVAAGPQAESAMLTAAKNPRVIIRCFLDMEILLTKV